MVPHTSSDEHYVCIMGTDAGADVLFCADGGVDVGDVDATAARVAVAVGEWRRSKGGVNAVRMVLNSSQESGGCGCGGGLKMATAIFFFFFEILGKIFWKKKVGGVYMCFMCRI
jgi:succinyl-CoA synthetase beta subunit